MKVDIFIFTIKYCQNFTLAKGHGVGVTVGKCIHMKSFFFLFVFFFFFFLRFDPLFFLLSLSLFLPFSFAFYVYTYRAFFCDLIPHFFLLSFSLSLSLSSLFFCLFLCISYAGPFEPRLIGIDGAALRMYNGKPNIFCP